LIYQVVSKGERTRGSVPKLGSGLDAEEQGRLTRNLQARQQAAAPPRSAQQPPTANPNQPLDPNRLPGNLVPPAGQQPPAQTEPGVEPATVAEQKPPEYPPGVTKSGTVVVDVDVGPLGEPIEARVVTSTDSVFDPPALEAARQSTYTPKKRFGAPERSTVRLTFQFRAPQD
jgi:TonB family protein